MKIIDEGYTYELENLDLDCAPTQQLKFIKKEPAADDEARYETVQNGTTNEEVLEMLISRLQYLQREKLSCKENACTITKLEEALMWLNKRTNDRKNRGVLDTQKP